MRLLHPFRLHSFVLASVTLLALVPYSLALAQEMLTVNLEAMNGSPVRGTIVLNADGDATDATVDLTGLAPNAQGSATLHANTCEQPSASFAIVAQFTADASGNVHATGRVLFHNTDVALASISDGGRIISIHSGEQVVACGRVPALTSPALPNTGGAVDSGLYVMPGVIGVSILLGGLALVRRART